MNPVFVIIILIAAVIVWFLISPLFGKIGDKAEKKVERMFGDDEDKDAERKEGNKDE